MYGYQGKGAYKLKNLTKDLGVKSALRSLKDAAATRAVSYISGRGAYSYRGRGAYRRTSTNAMTSGIRGADDDSYVFSNREYVMDIIVPTTAGAYVNTPFALNPGIASIFPWLSQVAANFEEYEFLQLVFEYRPTIDASTVGNGQTGVIMIATQYNPASPPIQDKETMLQTHGAQSCKLTDAAMHGVECDPRKVNDKRLYVRTGPLPQGEDIKTYDHGTLNIAIVGAPAAFVGQNCGELWVYYKVRCKKQKFAVNRGAVIQRDCFFNAAPSSGTSLWNYSDWQATNKFYRSVSNNIGCMVCSGTGWPTAISPTTLTSTQTILYFPNSLNGYFRVTFKIRINSTPTGQIFTSAAPTVSGNVKVLSSILCGGDGGTGTTADAPQNFSDTAGAVYVQYYECEVYVTSSQGGVINSILFASGTPGGTIQSAWCEVLELNPAFLRTDNKGVVVATDCLGAFTLANSSGAVPVINPSA